MTILTMKAGLFTVLLHVLAIFNAGGVEDCTTAEGEQPEEITPAPPFSCDQLEWVDDETLAQTLVEPLEVEFVQAESFSISCKVCTRPGYNLTIKDIVWSKQEGELPEDTRNSNLDLMSQPAVSELLFTSPKDGDEGVYVCRPEMDLTVVIKTKVVATEAPASTATTDSSTLQTATNNTVDNTPTTDASSTEDTSGHEPEPRTTIIVKYVTEPVNTADYSGYCRVTQAVACAGDDPRFSLPLADGNMLCFSVDGKGGDIFNLVSDKDVTVNVRYIDGIDGYSVWMGEVAIVLNTGCKVRVNAKPETVLVDNTTVGNYFHDSDVTVEVSPGDYVKITLNRLNVQFQVEFIDEHLSFYILKSMGFSPDVHGLLGQFWNSNHKVSPTEEGQNYSLLKRQGRSAAVLMKQKRWPFMHGHRDATCWAVQGKHPGGAVDWSHSSYKMQTLCQTKQRILKRQSSSMSVVMNTF